MVVDNHKWLDSWNAISCPTLTTANYGHYLILLNFLINEIKHIYSFKFMEMWASNHDCINVVKNTWNEQVTGCRTIVLN